MKGTEKQIAWAEDIKSKLIAMFSAPELNSDDASKAVSAKMIDGVNSIEYAAQVIDMFKDCKFNGDVKHDAMALVTEIKVNPTTKRWHTALIAKQ